MSPPAHTDTKSPPSPPSTTATTKGNKRLRRAHRKSRRGCSECKRRHIRCDESHPACFNCSDTGRTCVYATPPAKGETKGTSPVVSGADSRDGPPSRPLGHPHPSRRPGEKASWPASATLPTPQSMVTAGTPSSLSSNIAARPGTSGDLTYTADHLELFRHLERDVYNDITILGHTRYIVDLALHYSGCAPYFLDQLLALAAVHLSHVVDPEASAAYRHQATELQTRALAQWTQHRESHDGSDEASTGPYKTVPWFMFTVLLTQHMFAETLDHRSTDFHTTIDRTVSALNLSRGVVIVAATWGTSLPAGLEVFLKEMQDVAGQHSELAPECDPLTRLMTVADLTDSSKEACEDAIERLRWSFNIYHRCSPQVKLYAPLGFAVRITVPFLNLLKQHRPEALVILAYHGILLHRCRHYWAYGDRGASLIEGISQHLGSAWTEWLDLPLRALAE